MYVLSSSWFLNRVMILFIFKMQDMHSPNLSRIRNNITSFSKHCVLLPWGFRVNWLLVTRVLFVHRVSPTPKAALLWACGRIPAAAREEVTQPVGSGRGA